jgi:hypothetical protein
MAGKEWTRLFMTTDDETLIRKPEATSLSQSEASIKTNADNFLNNPEDVYKTFGPIPPERIWNKDEIVSTAVQNLPKIIAPKGVEHTGNISRTQ